MRKLRLFSYVIFTLILLCPALTSAAATDIKADKSYFDYATGMYVLEGNVSVRVKDAYIQAQRARFSLTTLEVYAEGNIVLTQADTCFRGDSVFVIGKEHRAIVEGNIRLESSGRSITCTKVDLNWRTKEAVLTNANICENATTKYVSEAVYNIQTKSLQY